MPLLAGAEAANAPLLPSENRRQEIARAPRQLHGRPDHACGCLLRHKDQAEDEPISLLFTS